MPLDEKAQVNEIFPVFSNTGSQPANQAAFNPTSLDNLQVLPKILREGILFIASSPALLLIQAANPNNTDITTTLHSTLSSIACLVFGTSEETASFLDHIHLRQQQQPLPPPQLHLWILATLYATATDIYQRIYGSFDYRTAEASYVEFAILTRHLVPPGLLHIFPEGAAAAAWPASRVAFWKYWDEQVGRLRVSDEARAFAAELLQRDLPWGVGCVKPALRAVTVEMLPGKVREGYGLRSTVGTRGVYAVTMGGLKPVYPGLPRRWRGRPVKYYLGEVKRGIDA
ncbi:hypothetical protein BJX76DRAFT_354263 [Aspergillus varians]